MFWCSMQAYMTDNEPHTKKKSNLPTHSVSTVFRAAEDGFKWSVMDS